MLRSNCSFYPWKTLSLWCVTGFYYATTAILGYLLRQICFGGYGSCPCSCRHKLRHPWRLSTQRDFLGSPTCTPELHPSHLQLGTSYSYVRPFTLVRNDADMLMECDFVWIRNTSGYQPDISLPGSVFIVLEERLVVVAQNGWDVEFHNSITPSLILFLLTGTQSWRWKSSCPALQLLQTRW